MTRRSALVVRVTQLGLAAKLAAAGGTAAAAILGLAVVLLAWMAVVAGAGVGASCSASSLRPDAVPAQLVPIFAAAADQYRLGPRGTAILAALTKIESGFGQNMGPSTAGAIGWTQFLPSTWRSFGVDADGDGRRDPYDPDDAIHSSANYLSASGAPGNWRRALFAYNHSNAYVDEVLAVADELGDRVSGCAGITIAAGDAIRITGGGQLVPIPGFPTERVARGSSPTSST